MFEVFFFLAAALVLASAVAMADRPPPHKPPQEAIDACANGKSGDACSFSLPARDDSGSARTISGTCDTPPEQNTLACHPAHMHGPPHGGSGGPPPPE